MKMLYSIYDYLYNSVYTSAYNSVYNSVSYYTYNYSYNYNQKDGIDYNSFNNILELVPSNNKKITTDISTPINNSLVQSIKIFCSKANCKTFAISLSGGIDSMVLATIIKQLGHDIVALHINYNNRDETQIEQDFLKKWCKYNDIPLYVKEITDINRKDSKRSEYEAVTKNIRFTFYKETLENLGLNFIMLAHHKDDIVENIFANVCRGRYILDLSVIREKCIINEVTICRPMIEYYKNDIYNFAHQYNVPYFNDTTPKWSVRGKYRDIIAPAIEDTFSQNVKNNLIEIGKQSDQWNELVNETIIKPFLSGVEYTDVSIRFNIEHWLKHPLCFWSQVLMILFYKYGKKSPSRRSVQNFMNNLSLDTCLNIAITNNTRCRLKNNWITIEFI